ncbi:hypothetical protein BCR33DRAFT_455183 [Rhizoclosmatium globosum]|uniref:Secreted protein n=1 Tax=Rhizoclosmatium globosum TaxID=329046 RepID=A0A1Y2CWQ6_9FUNG|nr:hypothetical protein BCR33DRAFT_455183 [Rhizoclosmatium globosum]|eukprot:ORY51450.1 hypothetical protein BCR33DRAFT_455183 [Rhizoclosmatium globosum]
MCYVCLLLLVDTWIPTFAPLQQLCLFLSPNALSLIPPQLTDYSLTKPYHSISKVYRHLFFIECELLNCLSVALNIIVLH